MSVAQVLVPENTWEEVSSAEAGTIFKDVFDEGLRFIIMKGGSSLCAYIGIPSDHPIAGFDYDDIPVGAHGGLTYSNGDNERFPKGYWWYGWDYAHSGDYCDYYDKESLSMYRFNHGNDRKWTVVDVEQDSWSTIYDFKKLIALAERISQKKATA